MPIAADKSDRYHGDGRITLSGDTTLTNDQQLDGTLLFEGTLSEPATVTFQEQIGGWWYVHNGTAGGHAIIVRGTSGLSVMVLAGTTAQILYLRGIGIVQIESNAASFRGQPYASTEAHEGHTLRYTGGVWVATPAVKKVRYITTTGAPLSLDPDLDEVLCVQTSLEAFGGGDGVQLELPPLNGITPVGKEFTIVDSDGNAGECPITLHAQGANKIRWQGGLVSSVGIGVNLGYATLINANGLWLVTSQMF